MTLSRRLVRAARDYSAVSPEVTAKVKIALLDFSPAHMSRSIFSPADSITKLEEDPEFTRAYPGAQGSEVIVTLRDDQVLRKKMSDLVPATPDQIRARFRSAAGEASQAIEDAVNKLEQLDDVGSIAFTTRA